MLATSSPGDRDSVSATHLLCSSAINPLPTSALTIEAQTALSPLEGKESIAFSPTKPKSLERKASTATPLKDSSSPTKSNSLEARKLIATPVDTPASPPTILSLADKVTIATSTDQIVSLTKSSSLEDKESTATSTNASVLPTKLKSPEEITGLPLHEFHRFPRLPIEIRLAIWKLSLPGRNYVEVIASKKGSLGGDKTWALQSKEVAPTLFFACKESRCEVTKCYIPLRGTDLSSPVIYFSFEKDFLKFANYAVPYDSKTIANAPWVRVQKHHARSCTAAIDSMGNSTCDCL